MRQTHRLATNRGNRLGVAAMRVLVSAFAALSLAGCATVQVNRDIVLTGCDHESGWSDQVRAVAAESWLNAQMAANSYQCERPVPFRLPSGVTRTECEGNDIAGMAYAVFERPDPAGGAPVRTLSFRGTENDNPVTFFQDWVLGNLGGLQNPRGLDVLDRLVASGDFDEVTGHSLGGGIATYVSLCREGLQSRVFNASPRFTRCNNAANPRDSVVEIGEALFVVRGPLPEADQTYTAINCLQTGSSIYQHGMPLLARCLTEIAAYSDPAALDSLTQNGFDWPIAHDPATVARRRTACVVEEQRA